MNGLLLTDTAGTIAYVITNLHGDILGATDTNGTYTANPIQDEFGVGTDPASGLGWLGDKQRFDIGDNLGLIQMGARLYDPNLERFRGCRPAVRGVAPRAPLLADLGHELHSRGVRSHGRSDRGAPQGLIFH